MPNLLCFLAAAVFLAAFELHGQDESPSLEPAAIEERITRLESASPNADDSERKQTIAIYQEALIRARQLQLEAAKESEFQRRISEIPAALASLKALDPKLADDEQVPPDAADLPPEELTQHLDALKLKLAAAQAVVAAHTGEEKLRRDRAAQLPEIIAKAHSDLASLASIPAPLASASALEQANHQRLLIRTALLKQQIATFQLELQFYEASAELFANQGAIDAQRLSALTNTTETLQGLVDQRRLATTSKAAEQAQKDVELFAGVPEAQAIAAENAKLAKQHGGKAGLSQKMADATARLAKLEAQLKRVSKQRAAANRRVELLESAKLTIDPTTGQLLREQRQRLPDQHALREQLRETLRQSAQAQIDLIELEDRQAELLATPTPSESLPAGLKALRAARTEHLRSLVEDSRAYIATLASTNATLRSLSNETRSFSLFVDERLLWIPSTETISLAELKLEAHALREMFAKGNLQSMIKLSKTPIWALAGLAFCGLIYRRKTYLTKLKSASKIAQNRSCTSFTPTAKAFGYTLLIAAPLPFLAWIVFALSGGTTSGLHDAFRNVAAFLTFTILFKVIAHPGGLMVDHFRLSADRVAILRKHLRWFTPLMAPFVFFASALPIDASASSAGRLFFIGALLVLLSVFLLLLKPSKKLIYWRGKAPNHLARACFFLGIATPSALIIGAAAGYFASVQQLRLQSLMSVWLILVALFIAAMLYRWILVSRRRLAVSQALERRTASLAKNQAAAKASGTKTQHIASPDEVGAEALKVVEVEEQTSRLVRALTITLIAFGIWGIWMPTVPALSALDKVTLWGEDSKSKSSANLPDGSDTGKGATSNPLTDAASSVAGSPASEAPPSKRVTLQDLAASLITLLLIFVAARNIPGLLELTIFRRLRLKPGSSFAFTTTIRYLIVVTGIIVALGMIDITWGKVQWIAAAITLGIGFGLQEIFANFVAGLIILFERPIRLGDVVTVGDVSGKVSQIRIRATTIRQFNSRELIVPNKEFITGKLVNWTLSDSVLRLEILVGIAYGSDTRLATEILEKIATDNPRILKDPAPDVLFEDFGNSSLLFQLRAHVGSVDDLLPAKNDLRYAIDDAFRQAGIEIAFPQTDIHIRSIPGDVELPKKEN